MIKKEKRSVKITAFAYTGSSVWGVPWRRPGETCTQWTELHTGKEPQA